MASDRPLAYEIISKPVGTPSVMIGFIKSECAGCGKVAELAWRAHHNPNHISNHYKQLGWDYDCYRRAKIRCPDCKTAKPQKPQEEQISLLPTLKTFGARFQHYRNQAQLKRHVVAEQAGIEPRMLEWLELDQEHPFRLAQSSMNKLIDVLIENGVTVDRSWLLDLPQQGAILAANVRAAMQKYFYTESTLADKSHVPISQIKTILSGAIATHYRLPDLAKLLGSTPEALMGLPEKGKIPVALAAPAKVKFENKAETTGERLREARKAADLSQARLADLIVKHGTQWNQQTLVWMISRIERNTTAPGETVLLGIAADILNVNVEWLMGRCADPVLEQPLPSYSRITEAEANDIRQQLVKLEGDISGLDAMMKEVQAAANSLKTRLEESTVQYSAAIPIPAILVNDHQNHTPRNRNGNGYSSFNGNETITIDRRTDTKQNIFARALFCARNQIDDVTVVAVENNLARELTMIIPSISNTHDKRRAYLHALLRREAVAKNGVLEKSGRGVWRFREGATI